MVKSANKTIMKRSENPVSIPIDLIPEILSRLPAKSVGQCHCVSKQWRSILSSPDFNKLFLTRSSARPRLLFVLQRANNDLLFFSSSQPQNQHEKSLVITADFHTKLCGQMCKYNVCSYASGLIYVPDYWISKDALSVLCNPITGQYVSLPDLDDYRKSTSYLGFDPIDKQFKVMAESYPFCTDRDHHKFLTLGTGELTWRSSTDCPAYDRSMTEGICIDGVLYYLAEAFGDTPYVIFCFDVRSEKFKFIDADFFFDPFGTRLVNYKGKLGGIDLTYNDSDGIELCVWVLEDVEKQEWSKSVYTLPKNEVVVYNVFVVGMTARGEIVLAEKYTSKPFYVFYFNPGKNTLQSVEIKGVGANSEAFESDCKVYAYVDHVEDLSVSDVVQLKHH